MTFPDEKAFVDVALYTYLKKDITATCVTKEGTILVLYANEFWAPAPPDEILFTTEIDMEEKRARKDSTDQAILAYKQKHSENYSMTQEEFDRVKTRILRDYPIRIALAKKLGIKLGDKTRDELNVLLETKDKVVR